MNRDFNSLDIVSQRPDEAILDEFESDLRKEINNRGLETIGDEDAGIHSPELSQEIESEEDFISYIDHSAGLKKTDLIIYASDSRGNRQIGERTEANISLNSDLFVEVYNALEEEMDIESAAFNFTGYGKGLQEAYNSAVPMVSFLLDGEDEKGVTVSYRNGGTVETIWSEMDESFREAYDSLFGMGLDYEGSVLDGEKETEWMAADYGFEDLEEKR